MKRLHGSPLVAVVMLLALVVSVTGQERKDSEIASLIERGDEFHELHHYDSKKVLKELKSQADAELEKGLLPADPFMLAADHGILGLEGYGKKLEKVKYGRNLLLYYLMFVRPKVNNDSELYDLWEASDIGNGELAANTTNLESVWLDPGTLEKFMKGLKKGRYGKEHAAGARRILQRHLGLGIEADDAQIEKRLEECLPFCEDWDKEFKQLRSDRKPWKHQLTIKAIGTSGFAVFPDSSQLVAVRLIERETEVKLYDLKSGDEVASRKLQFESKWPASVDVTADGKGVLLRGAGQNAGKTCVLDPVSLEIRYEIPDYGVYVPEAAVLLRSDATEVVLQPIAEGAEARHCVLEGRKFAGLSPDGKLMLLQMPGGNEAGIVETVNFKEQRRFKFADGLKLNPGSLVAISNDGKLVFGTSFISDRLPAVGAAHWTDNGGLAFTFWKQFGTTGVVGLEGQCLPKRFGGAHYFLHSRTGKLLDVLAGPDRRARGWKTETVPVFTADFRTAVFAGTPEYNSGPVYPDMEMTIEVYRAE